MHRFLLLVLFIALYHVSFPIPVVNACNCMGERPTAVELKESTAVFSGQVLSISPSGADTKKVLFRVYRVWKGSKWPLQSILTYTNEGNCGVPFTIGDDWLVYASDDSGRLTASQCARTTLLSMARDDLAVLGPGVSPPTWIILIIAIGFGLCVVWRFKRRPAQPVAAANPNLIE